MTQKYKTKDRSGSGTALAPDTQFHIRRGDVVMVTLDGAEGYEKQGDRPAVVVQNNTGNEESPTTIIAPITSQYDPQNLYPFEVEIPAQMGGLQTNSVVETNQLRTISVDERVTDILEWLPESKMAAVDEALRVSLGLNQ